MAVFATFDAHGLPTGFWPADVYPADADGKPNVAVPAGAVEISEDAHKALIAASGTAAWDGSKVVPYAPPPAPPATRRATTWQLMSSLTADDRALYPSVDGWDQRLFNARDTPWPEDDPQIARMAGVLKKAVAAWFDAALKPAG